MSQDECAHAERFNRTIQEEEFTRVPQGLALEYLNAFNGKLLDCLIWFNESRPHYAIDLRSPMQFLAQEHQCNMYWRDALSDKKELHYHYVLPSD